MVFILPCHADNGASVTMTQQIEKDGWKDIASAPRDGTEFLAYKPGYSIRVVKYYPLL